MFLLLLSLYLETTQSNNANAVENNGKTSTSEGNFVIPSLVELQSAFSYSLDDSYLGERTVGLFKLTKLPTIQV